MTHSRRPTSSRVRTSRTVLYIQGANLMPSLEKRRGLEGSRRESSREWIGIRMVVILLVSLIWWDHSHPCNHLTLSYILKGFSWKRLSNIKWRIGERIVWRTLLWQKLGDSSWSIKRYWIFFMQVQEQVCVLEPRATERKLATSRQSGCIFYFQLIWYSGMSFSHKSFLLYCVIPWSYT